MKRSTLITTISLLALMAGLLGRQAWAGSLTAGLPIKLGAYQGVLTVASTPNAVLEIGNAHAVSGSIPQGQDIASDKDIYLRPGSVTQANSLRLTKYTRTDNSLNQNSVDLIIPTNGQLCLYNGGTADCRNIWPNTGSGDTYWQVGDPGFGVNNSHLLPNTAALPGGTNPAIRVGTAANPVPASAGRAVEVYGDTQLAGSYPVVYLQNGGLDTGYENEVDTCVAAPFTGQICDPASPAACGNQPGNCLIDHWDIGGGAVHIGGNLQIGDAPTITPNISLYSPSNIRPYNQGMRYYGGVNNVDGTGSGIDADTIDSDTVLPFASMFCVLGTNPGIPCPNGNECTGGGRCQKNDFFFKTITNVSGTQNYLCLKTNNTKLCVTGPSAGAPCVDSSTCNGGTCTSLCLSQQQTCPSDPQPPASKQCYGGTNEGTACTSDANCQGGGFCTASHCEALNNIRGTGNVCNVFTDCQIGHYCIKGRLASVSNGTSSAQCQTSANATCATTCANSPPFNLGGFNPSGPGGSGTNIVCDGRGTASCSTFGSAVTSNQGVPATPRGSANGPCAFNGVLAWNVTCDCYLSAPKSYSCTPGAPSCPGAPGPTAGADLCTPLFQ